MCPSHCIPPNNYTDPILWSCITAMTPGTTCTLTLSRGVMGCTPALCLYSPNWWGTLWLKTGKSNAVLGRDGRAQVKELVFIFCVSCSEGTAWTTLTCIVVSHRCHYSTCSGCWTPGSGAVVQYRGSTTQTENALLQGGVVQIRIRQMYKKGFLYRLSVRFWSSVYVHLHKQDK